MKLKEVKINGFGKLENKNIKFGDSINIIYGKNEAGKSTLLKFIDGMLYGLSKNKNGEPISDIEKYKPWDNRYFSGKIKYELDDGSIYEIYRDFNKKSPIIYNEFGEDISNEFKRDKSKGIPFLEEQIKIDKELYLDTAIIEQEKIRLKSTSQMSIINKITNLVTTGDDVISYKNTIDKLKSEQLEKIGTERTTQKPINKINSQIDYLIKEKAKLDQYKNNYAAKKSEIDLLNQYIASEKRKLEFLKMEKNNLDNNSKIDSEIKILKNNKTDIEKRINLYKRFRSRE